MISEERIWEILSNYFKKYGFVNHQTEAFDYFINTGLPKIITEESNIVVDQKNKFFKVVFSDIYIPKPTIIEEDRTLRGFYPSEARVRDLTYDSPIYATITEYVKEGEEEMEATKHFRSVIGRIPIMLRSSRCYLTDMTPKERIEAGECEYDNGGYFILKGKERVLVCQIRSVYDIPFVFQQKENEKYKYICEVRSMSKETGHSVSVNAVFGSDYKTIAFLLPYIKGVVPVGILIKALGFTKDEEILDFIGLNVKEAEKYLKIIIRDSYIHPEKGSEMFSQIFPDKDWNDLKEEEKNEWNRKMIRKTALKILGKSAIHIIKESDTETYAQQVVENELFPHMGIITSNKEKAYFIGHIINKLLSTVLGYRKEDDKDDYINKRVESVEILCYDLFRQVFKKYTNTIITTVEKKKQTPNIISIISKLNIITNEFRRCFMTGNWGLSKNNYVRTGVSQILSRLSYGATLSNLRRLTIPVGKEAKNSKIRQIHPSQIMFLCPAETPEGQSVGIVLNLSLLTKISFSVPTILVKEVVENCDNLILLKDYTLKNEHTKVFLNGILFAMTIDSEELLEELKELRDIDMLPRHISLSYKPIDDEVHIFSDEGRLLRPVFTLDSESGNKKLSTDGNETNWDILIEERHIEYLDNMEVNNSVIAFNQKELHKFHYDYCEIDASMMLGVMASIIPFPDHSQAPRNSYESSMGKQAISMYNLAYRIRTDTITHVLTYPQKPLVTTKSSKLLGFSDMPVGMNAIVAIACYTGYNQEDSVIVNQSALERGFFWASSYRTHSEEEKKQGTHTFEWIGLPPLDKRRKDVNYGLLDENGIIRKRFSDGSPVYVRKGDAIIGKYTVQTNKSGDEEINDCTLFLKKGEDGYIDEIFQTVTPNGYKLIKIKIRTPRIPEVGDKFASVNGQKGTVGMVYKQEDMPFSGETGISPEIIINPHCLFGDTLIQLANGETEYIKDIYDKDFEILTVNPNTLDIEKTKYKNGFKIFPKNKTYRIDIYNGKSIKCTSDHKFIIFNSKFNTINDLFLNPDTIKDKHDWVETEKIKPMDLIMIYKDGEIKFDIVTRIEEIEPEYVYDFETVSDNHSFIANGFVSHNCIPSRMTINQLMESVLGKGCALKGEYGDATPFGKNSVNIAEKLCDELGKYGFERTGKEMLYNGMTGEPMGQYFIGPVYYQRLKHLVKDKIHCLTGDHEVLTQNGWKNIKEITLSDYVAILDGEEIKYEKPLKVLHYEEHIGYVYILKNKDVDLTVTSKHRMYVYDTSGEYKLIPMEDLDNRCCLGMKNMTNPFIVFQKDIRRQYTIEPVYCLQVRTEVFYVRRNGKAVWTGNSRQSGPVQTLCRQPLCGRSRDGGKLLPQCYVIIMLVFVIECNIAKFRESLFLMDLGNINLKNCFIIINVIQTNSKKRL